MLIFLPTSFISPYTYLILMILKIYELTILLYRVNISTLYLFSKKYFTPIDIIQYYRIIKLKDWYVTKKINLYANSLSCYKREWWCFCNYPCAWKVMRYILVYNLLYIYIIYNNMSILLKLFILYMEDITYFLYCYLLYI